MAKNLLEGKLIKDKVQKQSLTPEQIEAMHVAMTAPIAAPSENNANIKTETSETKDKKNKRSKSAVAELEATTEHITRLSIDVTKEMHKAMKMKVIETEQSIRDYVVALIRKDLGIK